MFTKVRIPKQTNCVRFHASNVFDSYQLVKLFLSGKGRIANAIDLMKARIKYGFNHPIWSCYITTSSTEWFGLSRESKPFIVVLHNPGPLMDENVLREKYVYKRENNHELNVIPREMFLDVFDGKYGKVDYVSLHDAIFEHNDNHHKYKYLTKVEIEKGELTKARLDNNHDYIDAHFQGSTKENLEKHKHRPGDIDMAFLECSCDDYFPEFIGLGNNPQRFVNDLSSSPIDLEKEAVGHFLCFGALANVNSSMIASEVNISDTRSDCAFLAVIDDKEEVRLGEKVCMYNAGLYRESLSSLFVPNDRLIFTEIYDLEGEDFYQVEKVKGWYFTDRKRKKVAIGSKQKEWFVTSDPTYSVGGEPEFLVKSLKPLGRRTIKILISEGFYTPEKIKETFKDSKANAFRIIDGFKKRGNYYIAVAEYYMAEVYVDRYIPTEKEILKDYKLLGRIL